MTRHNRPKIYGRVDEHIIKGQELGYLYSRTPFTEEYNKDLHACNNCHKIVEMIIEDTMAYFPKKVCPECKVVYKTPKRIQGSRGQILRS